MCRSVEFFLSFTDLMADCLPFFQPSTPTTHGVCVCACGGGGGGLNAAKGTLITPQRNGTTMFDHSGHAGPLARPS